jgi:hypothetical protein
MQTLKEEEYVSLRLAHGDLENAIRLLNRAKAESDDTIKRVIVQHCIIEYAKPFTMSKGKFRTFIPLNKSSVFPDGNSDHETLMTERNQRIAHSDIIAWDPTLHYPSWFDGFPIAERPSHLYDHIDPLIDKMLAVCDVVLSYLVNRMAAMETEFRKEIALNK